MRLRLVLTALFLLLLPLSSLSSASRTEQILDFHSDITLKPDGTFLVRETIIVNSTGAQIRHGKRTAGSPINRRSAFSAPLIFRRTRRGRTSSIERRRSHAVLLLRFELERFYHGRILPRFRQQLHQRYLLLFVRSRLFQRVQWRLRWRRWLVAPLASRAKNPTYAVFRALSPTSRCGTRALESHSRRPRSSPACSRRRS